MLFRSLDTVREEERARGGVIELTPIVTLDGLDGEAELSRHPGEKVKECGECLRLSTQGKSSVIMREIINHHQVFIARNTEYRRCPQVAMYKIKNMSCMRRRGRKRKSNMAAKLARMTQVLIRSPSIRHIGTTTKLCQNIAATMSKSTVPNRWWRKQLTKKTK